MNRHASRLAYLLVLLTAAAFTALPKSLDPVNVRVHEWGTFTSIAGEDGAPISWQPFGGPTDLPCFVNRFGVSKEALSATKEALSATVRMETPVLYFYSERETPANVKVSFPKGQITEWYPSAAAHTNKVLDWQD